MVKPYNLMQSASMIVIIALLAPAASDSENGSVAWFDLVNDGGAFTGEFIVRFCG